MKTRFPIFLLLAAIVYSLQVRAAVKLPALIGNNMVLQQNATINVWGWADADEKITVKASWLNGIAETVCTADGTWKTNLQTPAAGGPFTMDISGRDYTIQIQNVMIGEVWVCSGQSNMEFTMRGLGGWQNYKSEERETVARGMYSNVRLFTVGRDTSAVALNNCKGNWLVPDTSNVNDFSATAWFYGAYLNKQLGIPVGLISTAWGGTPAEVWTPVENIRSNPELGYYLNHFNGSQWWPGTPGVLFNAMIHPLLNYSIKGAIWYQGESNRMDSRLYPELINTMISSWRKAWGNEDFPFYFVQIAPFTYTEPYTGALLREAQQKCLSIPNTGMAVTMDLVDNIEDIHPKNKLDVGKRLALCALNKTYHKSDVVFSGPLLKSFVSNTKNIILNFNHADGGLKMKESSVTNFTISAADRVFYPAKVRIEGDKLVVYSSKVKNPVAVRYAFTNTAEATLFNGAGLPSPSFRTDNWDIITENISLKATRNNENEGISYQLSTTARESDIYYALNTNPGKTALKASGEIALAKPGTLFAVVSRDGYFSETVQQWKFLPNKASTSNVTYTESFSDYYDGGGKLALIDGIQGTNSFQDGIWQGFEGNNLEVILDLQKTTKVKRISCNFLSENKSWIFLPQNVQFEISADGITYTELGRKSFNNEQEVKGTVIERMSLPVNKNIRYIRVKAKNQGKCPAWHSGAGSNCWIFADEITVE